MREVLPTLAQQSDERLRILKIVLANLKAFNHNPVLQSVAQFVQVFIIKSILIDVQLLNNLIIFIVILEACQDEVETRFG